MEDLTNPNLSPEELKRLMEERERANSELEQARNRAKQSEIEKRLRASEAEWEANRSVREANQAKEVARKAELLSPEDWKAKYGSKYSNNVVEDMSERLAPSIDDFKKAARIDKLKSLAKGIGKGVAQGAAWGFALDPSEIANSEMPYDQEGMDKLQSDMQAKNEQYNRPTKFSQLRKLLGK